MPAQRSELASTTTEALGSHPSIMQPTLDSSPPHERAAAPVPAGEAPRVEAEAQSSSVKLGYLPSLDGLRAVAVMAVLIYHSEIGWLPGGYLGVEVFFVISGYLITSLLMAERHSTGQVDLRGFWTRRARRLLPALYLLLVVVSAWWLIFQRSEVHLIRGDVLPALAYFTNWWLIFSKQSYFAQAGRPSPFLHLWSLAVEEQFYLLWPLIFVVGTRLLRNNRRSLVTAAVIGSGLSALLMYVLYNPSADPSRAYYGTDTRASGLLFGAGLAFLVPPWRIKAETGRRAPYVIDGVGLVAALGLVWFFRRVNEFDPFVYQRGFLLLDLLTVVIIVVIVHPAGVFWRKLLSLQPVVWIGQRSYGIYLWHWPVFVLTRPNLDISLTGKPLLALRLAITLVLAELSYRFVEQPIRHGALRRWLAQIREARAARAAAEAPGSGPDRTVATVAAALLLVFGVVAGLLLAPSPSAKLPPGFDDASARAAGTIPPPIARAHRIGVPLTKPFPDLGSQPAQTTAPTQPPASKPPSHAPTTGAQPTIASSTPPSTPASTTPTTPTTAAIVVSGANVTALGDSVMLGSRFAMQQRMPGIYVNAAVSRQWYMAPGIAGALAAAGYMRQTVVVHLGTNGAVTSGALDKLLLELGSGRRVLLVNARVDRPWEQLVNQRLAEAASSHANVRLLDWFRESDGHPEYFVHDGVHLTVAGSHAYASLIARSLR